MWVFFAGDGVETTLMKDKTGQTRFDLLSLRPPTAAVSALAKYG